MKGTVVSVSLKSQGLNHFLGEIQAIPEYKALSGMDLAVILANFLITKLAATLDISESC